MQKHIKILDVFYGNKCNIACAHCDTRSDVIRDGEYDPNIDTIKQGIVLANQKFDIENWSVLGGEPLLYKDTVLELVKFIRSFESKKTIFMSTNGLLLDKNIDWIVDLINTYKVWVQVCNHTAAFSQSTLSDKIKKSVHTIGQQAKLENLQPAHLWWNRILNADGGTEGWRQFLQEKNYDFENRDVNDIVYINSNHGIHYMEAHNFQTIYKKVLGKPKPYDSNDPGLSYKNSCPSQYCAFLLEKKIYKCGALGTLRNFLDKTHSIDDPDWQKYLKYKPVDLENCRPEDIEYFSNTHYTHISECSMCPEQCTTVPQTEINVLPLIKYEHSKL